MKKICFLFFIAALSCSTSKKDKESPINLNDMQNVQIEDEEDYYLIESDIDTLLILVNDHLKSQQFKYLDNNQFIEKINLLFLNLNKNEVFVENHNHFSSIISRYLALDSVLTNFEFIYDKTIYIAHKKQFIFSRPDEISIFLNRNNQEIIKPYLDIILHRNKYLFNDSKSSFMWLALNDSTFLNDLFVNYGYTQDKKLDKWILDNRLNNETIYDFGKAFYYKRFDNTVKFNPEVFEVFEEKANPKYMKQLNYLFSSPNFRDEYDLTFEQKAELFARLMYSAEEVAYKNQTVKIVTKEYPYYPDSFRQYIGTFTGTFKQYIDEDEIYYKEFKRNNFYNLPNFEEYWQSGQNFIQMMTPPQREIEEG